VRRREVIAVLGGAAAAWSPVWPRVTLAQQQGLPAVGVLFPSSLEAFASNLRAFRDGLRDAGYVEGENVVLELRPANDQVERLPDLAADLVRRGVAAILSASPPATSAAKAATATIPIVFGVAQDPVRLGFVTSLARPGGNLTGVNFLLTELAGKRLELLREMVPGSKRVAVLVNPANAANTESTLRDVQSAARHMGLHIQVVNAETNREIDAAFARLEHEPPDALFVGSGPLFSGRRVQLGQWAARLRLPAAYPGREYADVGGLMSYGSNTADAYRQTGAYVGRLLKGAKPADLPVVQSSKFELFLNAQTARILGLEIPPTLLARADEVIE
jgi:ABC-type uncharacterized transport system substrate-binding protein